ncbi:hypothetical protein GLOTRDRAFT_44808, partial [Gloeophyllum trabeum ATCC 11539]
IQYGIPRVLSVHFSTAREGRFEGSVVLTFWDAKQRQRFTITRQIRAVVGSRLDHENLRPSDPYVRPVRVPLPPEIRPIPAPRPPVWTATEWVNRLAEYPIPHALKGDCLDSEVIKQRMPNSLTMSSYSDCLDLQMFTMKDTELKYDNPNYRLRIPGLLDKKPRIIVGDKIVVLRTSGEKPVSWVGCVHAVNADEVRLRLSSDFSLFKGKIFDVVFQVNRMPLRRMHHAVLFQPRPQRLLFPRARHVLRPPDPVGSAFEEMVRLSPRIQDDPEKLRAVWTIVKQPRGSVPFVVFGPPGTGKTTAIVEAIRHLLKENDDHRILACAQSNRAADTIACKLLGAGLTDHALLRLNALWRPTADLPGKLYPISPINGNDVFAIPGLEDLVGYRVVVVTCVSAGIAKGLGVKRGHFSHIFVDEAGQCAEPEAMVAITPLVDERTNIILAGDPRQLPPVITSRAAATLGKSYLERIMNLDIYDESHTNSDPFATHVHLRRSHEAISNFSNVQFYDGELQNCGDPSITHKFLCSKLLVTPGFPVIFHGITGMEMREGSSPSFFNIDEASLVRTYCEKLNAEFKDLTADCVGIITPYLAQRGKILKILPEAFQKVKVGTVEEFQGQERMVIIVSTVRSKPGHVGGDIRHALGFVAQPRRTNGTLDTRGRALLIVIGDPRILSLDPTWRNWLRYVQSGGGARGQPIPMEYLYNEGEGGTQGEGGSSAAAQLAYGKDTEQMQRLRAKIVRREQYEGIPGNDSDCESDF